MGKTLKKADHTIGKSNRAMDLRFKAMLPGKRISSSGNIYYEYRINRADVNPSKRL